MTVVIPVRNGASTLDAQLAALVAAEPPVGPLEVIVADNGSTDATADVARARVEQLPLRVVDASARRGINYARNRGVLSSNHTRIVLCDSDDVVDLGWLTAMERAFDAGHDLIGGPIDYVRLNPTRVRAWRGAQRASVGPFLDFLPSAHGANLGFTREVFDRVGGFDEGLLLGGDDVDFCWRSQLSGASLHAANDAVVHYRLRPSLRALFDQARGYGSAEALLFRKFAADGLHRRPATAWPRDVWWLLSRSPFVVRPDRRGAWVRRLGELVGRLEGAIRHRVWWW